MSARNMIDTTTNVTEYLAKLIEMLLKKSLTISCYTA